VQQLRAPLIQGLLAITITTVCLVAATQWAAAMLGHQPELGTPALQLLGFKLYAPWKLFVWWLAFERQAPDVFARAGALAAFGGLAAGAVAIGGAARRAGAKSQATT
jgi:type IV secretion system protein VirD4